jgi:uncharacterized protein (DUF2267 family)
MSSTGLAIFDTTVEKTNVWLGELQATNGWKDRQQAYTALRAVLHALRDRLPPEEVAELAAQLPMLIRGFFYEGWQPAHKPEKYRHKGEFMSRVTHEAPWLRGRDLELAVTSVFAMLSSRLGREAEQARRLLPAELRELWPHPGM